MADAFKRTYILTLSCADRPRIVASVTTILAGLGGALLYIQMHPRNLDAWTHLDAMCFKIFP